MKGRVAGINEEGLQELTELDLLSNTGLLPCPQGTGVTDTQINTLSTDLRARD
jgi:hypothetical protein